MSIKFTVTNYHFYEPKKIREDDFIILKNKLQNDPNFCLIDKEETITNEFQFKNLVYLFLGGIAGIFIGRLIGGEGPDYGENIITKFGFIIMLAGWCSIIISFFGLLFGLPSMYNFARYIRKKRKYFDRLENEIKTSINYNTFYDKFYK